MQAIVGRKYGSADGLRLEEIEDPVAEPGHVVVRVRAASVNAGDWRLMRGEPYLARPLMGGLRGPKPPVRGWDLAGVVESVGADVTDLRPGDEVFGTGQGTFAELVSAKAQKLAPKPPRLSFEDASALPVAGITALQALRDRAGVEPGQRVLVNGAAGGVGTFTVQIAKTLRADVTAVCNSRNTKLVTELGADKVLAYDLVDFSGNGTRYDAIIDNVGSRPLRALRRALKRDGVLVVVGGGKGRYVGALGRLAAVVVLNRFTSQRLRPFLANTTRSELLRLADLVEAGQLKPVIERTYPLPEAAEAIRYVDTGHARGKVVVTII